MEQDKLKAASALNGRLNEDLLALDQALLKVEQVKALVEQQSETVDNLELANEGRQDVASLLGESQKAQKQQESWLSDLATENGELHSMVDELTTGLQVIMNRHRSQVSELSGLSASAVDEVRAQAEREKARTVALEEEVVRLTDQLEDMKGVMALSAESYAHDDLDIVVEVTQLERENALLREALKVSRVALDDTVVEGDT
eukprot:m.218716 g.218716  ORF g.218716 m.218716 type:complete len:202 (-) comp17222_c0_seq1:43-648(-)